MAELRGVVGRLAAAIADREPICWPDVERLVKSTHDQSLLRQLRAIAWLETRTGARRAASAAIAARRAKPLLWTAVLALAALQIVVLSVFFVASVGPPWDLLAQFQLAITSSFAAAAVILICGGGEDVRGPRLGHVYLLTAAAFAKALFGAVSDPPAAVVQLLILYPETFLPFALWQFVREFPRAPRFAPFDRHSSIVAALSLAIGVFLFANGWATSSWSATSVESHWRFLWWFQRTGLAVMFWLTLLSLMIPSVVACMWRVLLSPREERQRAVLFLSALLGGMLPLFVVALLRAVWPAFQRLMTTTHPLRGIIDVVVLCALLSVPFVTAYAVLVQRIIPVRIVVHRALRPMLARYTLLALILFAVTLPVTQAYRYRDKPLEELMLYPQSRLAAVAMLLGLGLLAARSRLVALIDRSLAGESRSRTSALAAATETIGRARTPREVAFEAARQIEKTLGASRVAVLLRQDDNDFHLLHGIAPPFPEDTALLAMLSESAAVRLDADGRLFALLPPVDREWLLRGQFDVVARVPFPARDVAGVAGVGRRRNGVPFSKHDLAFLSTVLTTAGLALHRPWTVYEPPRSAESIREVGALECSRCGTITARDDVHCQCGEPVKPAALPKIVAGKYEVLRRIGRGGMGVVYVGRDLRLERAVALKTLPQVSPDAAAAMFDEAKAMAAVEHPNLALIYSLEVWRDTPVLVVEYLAGGTLHEKLHNGPLSVEDALMLGALLADGLSALHDTGILHRDVKPSNVGFTKAGVPKLLDFGIAHLFARIDAEPDYQIGRQSAEHWTASTAVAGTPLYLSPEALNGRPPDVSVDVWGAAVVVLEVIAGTYPFRGRSGQEAVKKIRAGVPDWNRWREQMPSAAVHVFDRAFHWDLQRRQPSAAILADEFRAAAVACARSRPGPPAEMFHSVGGHHGRVL